jgi:RimJ/RimL family protein N-acetyltransferase
MLEKLRLLEDDVVRLRPMEISDLPALSRIAFDPNIWTYFVYAIRTPAELATYVDDAVRDRACGSRYTFVIEDRASGELIGSSAFGNHSHKDRRIEIGWSWVGVRYLGTGANKHAKFLLMSYAFDLMQQERVEFKTDVLNRRARHALLKIGAKEEGILRSHTLMPDGRRRDTIFYSVLASEWPAVRDALFADCRRMEIAA